MKKLIIIILILVGSKTAFSQQDMFAGIWKYQNGNEVFLVTLWRISDGYKGHYKKITVDASGNQISVIYDSNKPIGSSTTNWPFVISTGNISQRNGIGGNVADNTVTNTPNAGGFVDGPLLILILNPGCYNPTGNTCPLQAQWIVKKRVGLSNPAEPPFNIPTNIILTKQ